jgi:hypothetical protein
MWQPQPSNVGIKFVDKQRYSLLANLDHGVIFLSEADTCSKKTIMLLMLLMGYFQINMRH